MVLELNMIVVSADIKSVRQRLFFSIYTQKSAKYKYNYSHGFEIYME